VSGPLDRSRRVRLSLRCHDEHGYCHDGKAHGVHGVRGFKIRPVATAGSWRDPRERPGSARPWSTAAAGKGAVLKFRIRSARGPLTCLNSMQDGEPTVWRTVPEDR